MHEHANCNIKYNTRPRIYASDSYVTSTHAEISTPTNMGGGAEREFAYDCLCQSDLSFDCSNEVQKKYNKFCGVFILMAIVQENRPKIILKAESTRHCQTKGQRI